MQVTRRSRINIRTQNLVFTVLFLAVLVLLAWLSTRYQFQSDWTVNNRNSLAPASAALLKTLDKPVTIEAFAREDGKLRPAIKTLIGRYQRVKSDIALNFVNTDLEPRKARQLGITRNGELHISYAGHSEIVKTASESAITNALQRLARGKQRPVVFLSGHGERAPDGQRNFDLGAFTKHIKEKGFAVSSLSLAQQGEVPADTSVLVLAGPQTDYLPAEQKAIETYLKQGGNALILGDPGDVQGLAPIAAGLGVHFRSGMIVDAGAQLFGVSDPRIVLIAKYGKSPLVSDFDLLTVFPQATGLNVAEDNDAGWQADRFLKTLDRAWQEKGDLSGSVSFDPRQGDVQGPLTLGVALRRKLPTADTPAAQGKAHEQRVVVVGDGDFLANAYLGNQGNLDLGMRIFNWLSHDDSYIDIPARGAPDSHLNLSNGAQYGIGIFFLILLPLGLLVAGGLIWWRRRRR